MNDTAPMAMPTPKTIPASIRLESPSPKANSSSSPSGASPSRRGALTAAGSARWSATRKAVVTEEATAEAAEAADAAADATDRQERMRGAGHEVIGPAPLPRSSVRERQVHLLADDRAVDRPEGGHYVVAQNEAEEERQGGTVESHPTIP